MTQQEYFLIALREKYVHKLSWFAVMLNIYSGEENEYCVERNGKLYMKVNGNELEYSSYSPDTPLLDYSLPITLPADTFSNVTEETKTSIGLALVNYLLYAEPLKLRQPYFNNKNMSGKDIETVVMEALKDDKITVEQYLRFIDNTVFLANLSRFILQPVSRKNLLPPPGIDKIKKEMKEKYDKKYGANWQDNQIYAGEFLAELDAIDREYLKGDPALGVTMVGKALDSRRKTLLCFGSSPSKLDPNPKFMLNSLTEGYELDEDIMSGVINGIIDGSLARGKETQVGGVIYKVLIKMGRDMKIVQGDCGTKLYKSVDVNEHNASSLIGYNLVDDKGNLTEIKDATPYVGKTIKVRSPLYCKIGGKSYCEVCVGAGLKDKKEGIGLMFTYISEVFLSASLKKMHNAGLKLTNFDIADNLK